MMLEDFSKLYDVLKASQEAIDKGIEKGLTVAGVRVMGTAKAKLGSYQPAVGPYPAWPKLSDEAVRRKHLSKSKSFHINDNGQVRINLTRAGKAYLKKHGTAAKVFRDEKKFVASGTNDDAPLVDTSHLRQAITTDTKDISKGIVYVGVSSGKINKINKKREKEGKKKFISPADYAATHEFGYAPKNIPARPYLRPAVYENKSEIQDDIGMAIKEELENLWQKH